MRIEFFGLPGVGKTYITNLLIRRYPEIKKYLLQNKPSTLKEKLYDIPYLFKHPYLIYYSRFEDNQKALSIRFKRIARRRPYILKHNHRILVDCGLVQPLLEAYLLWNDKKREINWIELFNEVIMDHCFFLLSDSLKHIVHRELNRTQQRFNMNQADLIRKYQEGKYLINQIKKKMLIYEFYIPKHDSINILVDNLYQQMMRVIKL